MPSTGVNGNDGLVLILYLGILYLGWRQYHHDQSLFTETLLPGLGSVHAPNHGCQHNIMVDETPYTQELWS